MITATTLGLVAIVFVVSQAVRLLRNLLTARPAVPSTEIQ
jgi:hypothetical protein